MTSFLLGTEIGTAWPARERGRFPEGLVAPLLAAITMIVLGIVVTAAFW